MCHFEKAYILITYHMYTIYPITNTSYQNISTSPISIVGEMYQTSASIWPTFGPFFGRLTKRSRQTKPGTTNDQRHTTLIKRIRAHVRTKARQPPLCESDLDAQEVSSRYLTVLQTNVGAR